MTEKTLDTLVEDIYGLLDTGLPRDYEEDKITGFGLRLASILRDRLSDRESRPATLRMSNIGTPCNRKLWYGVNQAEDKTPLPPATRLKFLYGDILEELLLFLAEASGHEVTGRQDTQEIEGIEGHRDAVIDGVVVDAKSASTYSFKKFETHGLAEDDPFGYIDQLQSYLHAGQTDDKVKDKDRAAFLVVDKTLGHICLDIHPRRQNFPIEKLYQYKKDVVARTEPPARKYEPIPDGKSGNMKLGTVCSYCDFSRTCWPGSRTFLYANKPVTLVHVAREPNVPELTNTRSDDSE